MGAPEQFKLAEDGLIACSDKIRELGNKHVVPLLQQAFTYMDQQLVEAYIWFKTNEYDVKINTILLSIQQSTKSTIDHLALLTQDIAGKFPGYYKKSMLFLADSLHNFQLAVGEFLLNIKPKLNESISLANIYFNYAKKNFLVYMNIYAVKLVEFSKVSLEYGKLGLAAVQSWYSTVLGPQVVKLWSQVGPFWDQLVGQFNNVFDQAHQFVHQQLNN